MSRGPRSAYALLRDVQKRAAAVPEEPSPSSRPTRPMGPPKPRPATKVPRAPKVPRIPFESDHAGFSGVLRPGSRVLVNQTLRCGERVLQAGMVAVVTQTFPSLCLRAEIEPDASPRPVSFEQVVAATVKLPTTVPPRLSDAPPSVEIEFEVRSL